MQIVENNQQKVWIYLILNSSRLLIIILQVMKLLLFLLLVYGVSCGMVVDTWEQYFEAGQVYTNGPVVSTPSTLTITFLTNKTNPNYLYALAIKGINQIYVDDGNGNGRYSVMVNNTGNNTISGMTIQFWTKLNVSNSVEWLGVRYLVVEQTFRFMHIYHQVQDYGNSQRKIPKNPPYFKLPTIITNNSIEVGYIFNVISGYDIRDNNGQRFQISLIVKCYKDQPYDIICQVKTKYNSNHYLRYISVEIIVYYQTQMNNNHPGGGFKVNRYRAKPSDSNGSINWLSPLTINQTIMDNLFFYGIKEQSKPADGQQTSFHFNLSNSNNQINYTILNNQQVIDIFYIVFATFVECSVGQVYNFTARVCSLCPNGTFVSNNSCINCSQHHLNCDLCNETDCYDCQSPLTPLNASCVPCGEAWENCSSCNSSACSNCSLGNFLNTSFCTSCSSNWTNCETCSALTCLTCLNNFTLNTTNGSCFLCEVQWPNCSVCNTSTCLNCTSPYKVNSTFCDPNCSIIQNCTTCRVDGRLICEICQVGFWVSVDNLCVTTCGDGMVMGLEECDDNNTVNKDGCSSSCRTEEYFQCNSSATGGLSNCELTRLDISGAIMTKTEDKNEVTLSLDLYPKDLVYYPTADWSQAFSSFSHLMNLVSVSFDPSTNQLRVTLAYNENLEGQSVSIFANFSQVSSQFNMSFLSLSLPQTTSNNQALYHYEDSSYTLATAVEYLSMLVAGISLIFFALGYFGCKLQSLEAVAVVQVAALLLVTVKGMGPTYNGLKRLSYSLGVTPLFYSQNYFQESSVPSHLRTVLGSNDSFNLINVFLIVLVVPLITALVFKVLSVTKYQGSRGVERTWKFALGSFTYYGLLFLAYGELAFLALNLRHFQLELSCGLGVLIGVFFLILLGVYVIASYRYPTWFGSFSKKFHRFQVSQYFYIFSTAERLLTAVLIVSLSPGIFATGAAVVVFTAEAIFIAGKQPYSLKEWKRPFFNKVLAVVVSLLFVGASLTTADSMINEYIPFGILLVLMAVLTVGVIGSVSQLHQYWSTREENLRIEEKTGPPLSVEESNKILMREFEMRLMPDLSGAQTLWHPVQHDGVDMNRWIWEQYPVLGGLDLHMKMHNAIQSKVKAKKIPNFQNKEHDEEVDLMSHQEMKKGSDQI